MSRCKSCNRIMQSNEMDDDMCNKCLYFTNDKYRYIDDHENHHHDLEEGLKPAIQVED